jgi:hypothetical protein
MFYSILYEDFFGGGKEVRTPDPLLAKQVLSQLSYTPNCWWVWEDLNFRPHAYQACALTTWATNPYRVCHPISSLKRICRRYIYVSFFFERRWSSRRFPYGYLVTTSPQSLTLPWSPASGLLRLAQRRQAEPTLMAWRAVCTRPGNVFTAACWSAITSDSNFVFSSCREQSELRQFFKIYSTSRFRFSL